MPLASRATPWERVGVLCLSYDPPLAVARYAKLHLCISIGVARGAWPPHTSSVFCGFALCEAVFEVKVFVPPKNFGLATLLCSRCPAVTLSNFVPLYTAPQFPANRATATLSSSKLTATPVAFHVGQFRALSFVLLEFHAVVTGLDPTHAITEGKSRSWRTF